MIFVKNFLFICSQNRLRSPTAEEIFSTYPGIKCSSSGLDTDAKNPTTARLLEWADIIFVMEKSHRNKLSKKFKHSIIHKSVVCLDIPDEYEFMGSDLVQLLKSKVSWFLPHI